MKIFKFTLFCEDPHHSTGRSELTAYGLDKEHTFKSWCARGYNRVLPVLGIQGDTGAPISGDYANYCVINGFRHA